MNEEIKITIIPTNHVTQYRNWHFAEISVLVYNNVIVGHKYYDKCRNDYHTWYILYFNSTMEEEIVLPDHCFFVEDAIYCRDMEGVIATFQEIINKTNLLEHFPSLTDEMLENFKMEKYF